MRGYGPPRHAGEGWSAEPASQVDTPHSALFAMPFATLSPRPASRARWRRVSLLAALAALTLPQAASGQQSGEKGKPASRETATIEPYTGPPIYLPEVDPPPPPTVVERRDITENFPDSEKPRFERGIARLSDNSVVSDGSHKEYFTNGQLFVEGAFAMGRATGEWTYHHDNGQVAKKVSYVDGKPDGEVTLYNPDGEVIAKRAYDEGVRDGVWETYSPDGKQKLREESYAKGKPDGVFRFWFPNGQLRQEVPFSDGKREGVAKEWDQLGTLRAESAYKDNEKDGTTTLYRGDGAVVKQQYDQGRLTGTERSDEG